MKKYLWIIVVAGLVFNKCGKSKSDYILTVSLSTYQPNSGCPVGLYREYYRAQSSYMATDINSVYLTDSLNFRLFLNTYDEYYERINTTCKGDTLYVEKMEVELPHVTERKTYSLTALKQRHIFE